MKTIIATKGDFAMVATIGVQDNRYAVASDITLLNNATDNLYIYNAGELFVSLDVIEDASDVSPLHSALYRALIPDDLPSDCPVFLVKDRKVTPLSNVDNTEFNAMFDCFFTIEDTNPYIDKNKDSLDKGH